MKFVAICFFVYLQICSFSVSASSVEAYGVVEGILSIFNGGISTPTKISNHNLNETYNKLTLKKSKDLKVIDKVKNQSEGRWKRRGKKDKKKDKKEEIHYKKNKTQYKNKTNKSNGAEKKHKKHQNHTQNNTQQPLVMNSTEFTKVDPYIALTNQIIKQKDSPSDVINKLNDIEVEKLKANDQPGQTQEVRKLFLTKNNGRFLTTLYLGVAALFLVLF